MGEMTIRIDDGVLVELFRAAQESGSEPSDFACELIVHGLQNRDGVAHGRMSEDASTKRRAVLAFLREIQALQPNVSLYNSVDLIRDDRNR